MVDEKLHDGCRARVVTLTIFEVSPSLRRSATGRSILYHSINTFTSLTVLVAVGAKVLLFDQRHIVFKSFPKELDLIARMGAIGCTQTTKRREDLIPGPGSGV